ncbi:MAG: hypothetical protein PHC62_03040 [Candidatus Izemoplasmatales bacterium]|nr:hypothetical protein [Candidatus Izemoplasmatales bacterium]
MFDYEERLVLFVDILGFKNMIKSKDKTQHNNVIKAMEAILKMNIAIGKGMELGNRNSIRVTILSDSVCCSINSDDFDNQAQLIILLNSACAFQGFLLERGILSRGAICIGDFYHSEKILFGEALVDSYVLETTKAIYPRIIIDKKNLDYMIEKSSLTQKIITSLFKLDEDGYYYMNYLNFCKINSVAITDFMSMYKLILINKDLISNERIKNKYEWLISKIEEII